MPVLLGWCVCVHVHACVVYGVRVSASHLTLYMIAIFLVWCCTTTAAGMPGRGGGGGDGGGNLVGMRYGVTRSVYHSFGRRGIHQGVRNLGVVVCRGAHV